ncbi:MAG: phytoene desaturase [Rhodobacteraceae bacterium]|nr:MAG: phytoene desaturase [Paracoccaceae bacterium]
MLVKLDTLEKKIEIKSTKKHVVVIGAGFGGLAVAMRMGAKGYKVTVVDKLDTVGGRGSSIEKGGHRFDLGPTIITMPHLLEELWEFCGKRFSDFVDLRAKTPFYTIIFPDGTKFHAQQDETMMRKEVARLFPNDLDGYDRFMVDSERRYDFAFSSTQKIGRLPMQRLWDTLKVIPKFALMRADRSVFANAAKFVKDERLRMALSFHPLFVGGNPFQVTSMWGLVCHLEKTYGVHYAIGGSVAIANAMSKVVVEQGSTLRLNTRVDEILMSSGKVSGIKLANGEEIFADLVISNADSGHTYSSLLKKSKKKRWTDSKLKRQRWSMGLFVWYFGTKNTRSLWEDVDFHTVVNGPRYKGLVEDIFVNGKLSDDMSLYVHRPSVVDSTAAPKNCDTFYALSPVPNLSHENSINWEIEAEVYRKKVQEVLEKNLLPGLGEHLSESHVMTPLDFKDRYLSPFGSGFSMEPQMFQSAWFRPHNISENFPGLYLVGAGTHPGPGVPGVLASAEIVAKLIPNASKFLEPVAIQEKLTETNLEHRYDRV